MLDGGSAHITKRLLSEVDYTRRLGLHGIDVISRREDGKEWELILGGYKGTPWDGAEFQVSIFFGRDYPKTAPYVYFTTIPFHPSIDPSSGKLCATLLDDNSVWQERIRETSDLTLMCSVIMSIQLLLCEPNQENPVNLRALQMMNNKTATYNEVARDSVICSVHFGAGAVKLPTSSPELPSVLPIQVIKARPETPIVITKYEETPLEKYQRLFDFHSYHDTWLRRGVLTQKIPNEKYEKQEYHKVTQMLGGDPKEITKIVKSKGIQNDVHKEVDNYYHSINAEKVLAQRHDLFQKYTFSKSKRPDPLIKKIKVPKKKIISGWPDLADDSDSVMSWGSQIKGSGSEIDTSFHSSKQSVEEPNEDSDID